jgi:hypothetical protein
MDNARPPSSQIAVRSVKEVDGGVVVTFHGGIDKSVNNEKYLRALFERNGLSCSQATAMEFEFFKQMAVLRKNGGDITTKEVRAILSSDPEIALTERP